MNENSRNALVIAFYLSKFDRSAYKFLNFGGIEETHKRIGRILEIKASTIRNMRDEFDPVFDNSRRGWWKREILPSRKEILDLYFNCSEEALREQVLLILNPQKRQTNFNLIEESEISTFDQEAIEGELVERKLLCYKRNTAVVKARKELDNYTCQKCGFWYEKKIVECHHIRPISMAGVSKVTLNDLITLCPTCHRLVHYKLRDNDS